MHLVVPSVQLWTLAIGALVPLVTYVLNFIGPQKTEPWKAVVLVVASAAAAALYTALQTNVIGFNEATLELVLSGVVAAFGAHNWVYKPAGINAKLGGGQNRQPGPHRRFRFGFVTEPAPSGLSHATPSNPGEQPPAAA